MKINYLKINGFGKIKNKEINLNNNINLIYGKNESGKSTILKFIQCMLYGISKNKNGKEISNYDKYKPWTTEEFSGKIKYCLDNKEEYEVFREFSKKNPQIYNNNEDISNKFNIDKTKGNQFFYDQTKIDEALFLSTNIVEQQEVVLDNNNQAILTQKIANMLSSGEDNISYKKIMEKLSRILVQEVGTERTSGRPINEVTQRIKILEERKEELKNASNINNEIKETKKEIEENIKKIEIEIELLNEIKNIKEEEEIENQKININKKMLDEYNEKINKLKLNINNNEDKNNINKNNNKKDRKNNNKINLAIITILVVLNVLINFIKLPDIMNYLLISGTVIFLIIQLVIYLKNKNKLNNIIKESNTKEIEVQKEIEILEENKLNAEKEIINLNKDIEEKNNNSLNILKDKFENDFNNEDIAKIFRFDLNKLKYEIESLNKEYNNKRIEKNTLDIKEKEINNKMEEAIKIEEQLEDMLEQKEELMDLEKSLNIVKESLDKAYSQMKSDVTPKFTKDLSLLIENISSGKYKNAKFDSENGLRVENENGEYIDCNSLSIGTIDQLYLSLRLSSMNEISEEKMPIILDEAFAYFDNERLENILKFINENYKDNQVLVFTCSNREKEIMDKLNINYNLVEL